MANSQIGKTGYRFLAGSLKPELCALFGAKFCTGFWPGFKVFKSR